MAQEYKLIKDFLQKQTFNPVDNELKLYKYRYSVAIVSSLKRLSTIREKIVNDFFSDCVIIISNEYRVHGIKNDAFINFSFEWSEEKNTRGIHGDALFCYTSSIKNASFLSRVICPLIICGTSIYLMDNPSSLELMTEEKIKSLTKDVTRDVSMLK